LASFAVESTLQFFTEFVVQKKRVNGSADWSLGAMIKMKLRFLVRQFFNA
jgi:hypothetical protein